MTDPAIPVYRGVNAMGMPLVCLAVCERVVGIGWPGKPPAADLLDTMMRHHAMFLSGDTMEDGPEDAKAYRLMLLEMWEREVQP